MSSSAEHHAVAATAPLPVEAVLPDVGAALADTGVAVLEAEPGAGKTTRVPLFLLGEEPGLRMVVLEPRRVAARAAARRLASQLGEDVGRTVGLTTRDDRRVSAATRIEVVTEGVVLRRLQHDPSLPGVDLLVFDEFHERSLEADLSLAFALEARAALRADLRLLVMSATIDGDRVAALLDGAPRITAPGRTFPVSVEHRPSPSGRSGLAAAVGAAAAELLPAGDVLVFLPGVAEIRSVQRYLDAVPELPGEALIHALHGSLSGADQDAALRPSPSGNRRIVLATDLAESSLTIDGIRGVVDAGWSREPRFDAGTGMTGLVTIPASRASAEQRAGRAGRQAPGRCIRLWSEREHAVRDVSPRPAVLTDDLTGAALDVAAWGADVRSLSLLDQPRDAAWSRAMAALGELGAVDAGGRITAHGRQLNRLPVHPRLAHLLLSGRQTGRTRLACELAAVLGDRDLFVLDRDRPCADLAARIRVLRGEPAPAGVRVREGAVRRARRDADRFRRLLGALAPSGRDRDSQDDGRSRPPDDVDGADDPEASGPLVAVGWPDRVAGLRTGQRGRFLLAGGRGATLSEGDALAAAPYLAVAHLDRGDREARIHLAAVLEPDAIRMVFADDVEMHDEVVWRDGDVHARRQERWGALVLASVPIEGDDAARFAALLDGLREEGVGLLGWDEDARQLQARAAFLRRHAAGAWPDWSDTALIADAERLIGPFLLRARRRADLARVRMGEILRSQLTHDQITALDRLAPTHLRVASGSRVRLDYRQGEVPVLAVRIQELFGSARTPTVLRGEVPVLVHLLSPARRPVQITDDLAGFWDRSYPQVRAELRGRYPKHAWPENPTTAQPRSGTRR